MIPKLVFVLIKNPNYQLKKEVPDNLEYLLDNCQEYYDCCVGNYLTLGRKVPSFDEFREGYRNKIIKDFKHSKKCEYNMEKFSASSFKDIEDYYSNNKEQMRGFVDNELNRYFGFEEVRIG